MQTNDISLKDKIYKAVIDGILDGEYRPGQTITEKSLTEKYQVSKSPVRDAMIQLCNEKVLRSIPRYGYEIIRLTDRDIQEVIDFRLALELYSFRRIARNLTPDNIDELEQYARKASIREKEADIWHSWNTNKEFHLKLNSYLYNRYIYEQLERSLSILTRAYMQIYWDEWRRVVISRGMDEHLNMIKLLREGKTEEAEAMLKSDVSRIGSILLNR